MINTYIGLAKIELSKKNYISFPEELFENSTVEEAQEIVSGININALMMLPEKEIEFFEWVKEVDYPVWKDLWEDEEIEPYLVSVSFLPFLVYKSHANGFPICDLKSVDNYYFTISMMVADHSQTVLEAAKERFNLGLKLDMHQLLALEIAFNSVDIWHFAYKYHLSLEDAKQALNILILDKAIIQLTKSEEIAEHLQF